MNKRLLAYILLPIAGVTVASAAGVSTGFLPSLINKDKELEERIETLEKDVQELQYQIDTLKEEMETADAAIKADYLAQIENANNEIKSLQDEIKELEEQHKQDKADLIADYNAKISDLQAYIDGKVLELNNNINSNKQLISELTSKHNQEVNEIKEKHNQDIQALENNTNTKLQELNDEFDTKITSIQSQIDADVAALEAFKNQYSSDKAALDAKIVELNANIDSNKNLIDSLTVQHNQDIQTLAAQHDQDIQILDNSTNAKLQELNDEFETKISNIQSQIDINMAALQAFKTQYLTEKEALELSLQNSLANMEADYSGKINTINACITALTNNIINLKNEMNEAIQNVQNDYNTKINSIISKINTLESYHQYHTVTFNSNGGTPIASVQVQHGENVTKPNDPTKDGYNFENWTCEDERWSFIGYVVTKDITLEANWSDPIEYNITYNLDGGYVPTANPSTYTVEDTFSLVEPKKVGYTFAGWYDQYNSPFISFVAGSTIGDLILKAKWTINYYSLNVSSDDITRGTVSGSGTFAFGSNVTVNATPVSGKTFKGWYNGEELVSTAASYSFNMPANNYSLVGKFLGEVYTINFVTNGGDPIDTLVAEQGDSISINPTRKGYSFVGWYTDSSCSMSSYFDLGNVMPAYNGTLYAKWSLETYAISYHLDNRTTNHPSNPTSYNVLSSTITLLAPTVDHGTFEGWYTDELYTNPISNIPSGCAWNIELYAKETPNIYTISFVTNGAGTISAISGAYGDSVVIPTPTKENAIFVGWFLDSSLTQSASITSMPGENITLYAKWSEMYKVFSIDGKDYMYFGSYPQNVVSDESTKNELKKITTTNARGYYEYNGFEYAKQYVRSYNSSYKYSNGSSIVNGSTEYFKVEPILWRVLKSDISGNYTLLADQAINAHAYSSNGKNNYANSDIRNWINNDFYNSAFNSPEKGSILTTIVDNSAGTTNSVTNPYACENTNDKVYLLSYKDYINPDYGFSSSSGISSTRYCKPTDYALANYCYMYQDQGGSYDRNCYYWTRSPSSDYSYFAWCVDSGGYLNYDDVCIDGSGVRPALNINL